MRKGYDIDNKPKNKILLVIAIVLIVLCIIVFFIFFSGNSKTPKKDSIIGTWTCTDGSAYSDVIFDVGENIKIIEPSTGKMASGTYRMGDYNKTNDGSYGIDGYKYWDLFVTFKKVNVTGTEEAYPEPEEIKWLFGIKGNNASLVTNENNKKGITCTKK